MENMINGMITEEEKALADNSIDMALEAGASAVQVTFADGKYGVFSTNRLEAESVRNLLKMAVENVRLLAPDKFRRLPDKEETAKDAIRGDEMELCWDGYDSVTAEERLGMVRRASVLNEFSVDSPDREWKLVSEEVEYNNTLTSSDRITCRQIETSFEVCSNVTVEDKEGNKYSGLWWDYSISPEKVLTSDCGHKAVMQAASQIGQVNVNGGKYRMVVSRRVSGRLVQPVLNALSGRAIQQKSSFLTETLDKKVFSDGLTILDRPREKGKSGSILFDGEGRACLDRDIIVNGVIKEYFINTYMSGKLGMPATSDGANRPVVQPFVSKELEAGGNIDLTLLQEADVLALCGSGILVTDFNGGNCNSATGDFSYGVEGFVFENGKIKSPVSGMLITGNMKELWSNLLVAASDPMDGFSRQVPTLAFDDVTFSA